MSHPHLAAKPVFSLLTSHYSLRPVPPGSGLPAQGVCTQRGSANLPSLLSPGRALHLLSLRSAQDRAPQRPRYRASGVLTSMAPPAFMMSLILMSVSSQQARPLQEPGRLARNPCNAPGVRTHWVLCNSEFLMPFFRVRTASTEV